MSDPFNILGPDPDLAPSFEETVRERVDRFKQAADRFEELYSQLPAAAFTDDEWRVVEQTAEALEESVERAEEGYVAVQYDANAWYRIVEALQKISMRLESAIGLMERVGRRVAPDR